MREFWITIADPKAEHTNAFVMTEKPQHPVIEALSTHVIEYSAYEILQSRASQFESTMEATMAERDRAVKERDELRAVIRAYDIEASSIEDRTAEAAHYNWLDDENERLETERDNYKAAYEEMQKYAENIKKTLLRE